MNPRSAWRRARNILCIRLDTIGDVLNISPLLMEKYIEAAQQIVDSAIVGAGPRIPAHVTGGDQFRLVGDEKKNARFMPFAQAVTANMTASAMSKPTQARS